MVVGLMEKLRNVAALAKKRKRDLLLIALWTIMIALVIIRTHHQFYVDNPMMLYYQIGYRDYLGPTATELDLAVIVLTSTVISIFLLSIKSVIYGYFASLFLACTTATVYIFFFNWYTLELGQSFSQLPFGWEWVVFMAFNNVFRYIFPVGITFSLIGVGLGAVVRVLTNRD